MICLCLFLFLKTEDKKSFGQDQPAIRVAVLQRIGQFTLDIRGRYQILDANNNVLKEGRYFHPSFVTTSGQKIQIGQEISAVKKIRVSSSKDITVMTGDQERRYRGEMDIIADEKNTLTVINILDLEEYTKGVLYHEVSFRWPLEAIKAQAVASRTYALYESIKNKDELFDVKSDIYSQVYGGRSAERYRTNIAANRTRGEILTYNGKVLPAYFHATCGGRTEDVSELWEHDLPPLKGIQCDYCALAPYYRWKKNFRNKDVQDKLNKNGYKLDLIEDIGILDRTGSGRVKTLKIKTRDGKITLIPGKTFREIIGPNVLKSNFFEVQMRGYYFDVLGKGWGHGVGMCQWGAMFMARARFSYHDILNYYYPGAEIKNINDKEVKW